MYVITVPKFGTDVCSSARDALDHTVDEALAATFGPDAAAPESQETAPPAPSAQPEEPAPTATPPSSESETVDAATTEDATPPAESAESQEETPDDAAHRLAELQAQLDAVQTERRQERLAADQEKAEAQRQTQEFLRNLALQRVQQRLAQPEDLDPHEYQQLQAQYTQLHAQPHVERATQAEDQAERLAAHITITNLTQQYELSEQEARVMAGMYQAGPEAMAQYAQSVAEGRQSRDQELATVRQQLNDLQLQLAAQGRRDSGADRWGPQGQPVTTDLDQLSGDAWMDGLFAQMFPARQGPR